MSLATRLPSLIERPNVFRVVRGAGGFFWNSGIDSSGGLYGVVSYAASQRTHEIGIRLALGAQRWDILKMIFAQGLLIVSIGVMIGLAVALAAARVVRNFLTASGTDPLTHFAASLALTIVALFACYVPSSRALRVDPMVALRHE